jgi:peptidyl-dipeptidase A
MVHFERDLYADPEADLDARWWELVDRFQDVRCPAPRGRPDWAAKIHLAAAPVYYHNYLLGEMLASQLRASLMAELGALDGPEVGVFLGERVFRPGALMRWDALVESALGRPLSAEDLAAEVDPPTDTR